MKNPNSFIEGIQYILKKKGWIDIPASGFSMYPLIREGDICKFVPLDPKQELKKGDIILFVNEEEHLVGHRYLESFIQGDRLYHRFKGDTNFQADPPVSTGQLIGKLILIKKPGTSLHPDGLLGRWWARVVFSVPALPRYFKWVRLRMKMRHHHA